MLECDDRQTDERMDRCAVAYTALAKLALQRAAKISRESLYVISSYFQAVLFGCLKEGFIFCLYFYRATACNATHGIAVEILSVCSSVRPSVCL